MPAMMPVMLIVWAAVVVCFLALLAYRAQVTRYEEDQLFLSDESGQHERAAQAEIIRKVDKIGPAVRIFAGASGLMTVAVVGVYVWNALKPLMQ